MKRTDDLIVKTHQLVDGYKLVLVKNVLTGETLAASFWPCPSRVKKQAPAWDKPEMKQWACER